MNQCAEDIVAEHDDGYIDQVVGYQYSGQCSLTIFSKCNNVLVGDVFLWFQFIEIVWGEAKKGYLRTAGKARHHHEHSSQYGCYQHSGCGNRKFY